MLFRSLILGKALSGGTMPVSAVLADDEIMLRIKPGEHGSTFGGNPVACAVAQAALEVIRDEKLTEGAVAKGERFRQYIRDLNDPNIVLVRGKGLLNAAIIKERNGLEAWDLCLIMQKNGVLAKPTHGDIIRFAPPLVITAEELEDALERIKKSIEEYGKA